MDVCPAIEPLERWLKKKPIRPGSKPARKRQSLRGSGSSKSEKEVAMTRWVEAQLKLDEVFLAVLVEEKKKDLRETNDETMHVML